MHRSLARATSAAAIAAILATPLPGVAGSDPTAAASPAPITIDAATVPTSQAAPTSYAMRAVVEPLREIGHVRAVSPFCKKFLSSSATAVTSALAYEGQLLQTIADYRHADFSNDLARYRAIKVLDADLRRLHDFAAEGRSELAGIVDLAKDSDEEAGGDLMGFRDALDGAKARQMYLISRTLARAVARAAEAPIYTITTSPADENSARIAFGKSSTQRILDPVGNSLPGQTGFASLDPSLPENYDPVAAAVADSPIFSNRNSALFAAVAGDELIERDLADAARHGKAVIDLEHC